MLNISKTMRPIYEVNGEAHEDLAQAIVAAHAEDDCYDSLADYIVHYAEELAALIEE